MAYQIVAQGIKFLNNSQLTWNRSECSAVMIFRRLQWFIAISKMLSLNSMKPSPPEGPMIAVSSPDLNLPETPLRTIFFSVKIKKFCKSTRHLYFYSQTCFRVIQNYCFCKILSLSVFKLKLSVYHRIVLGLLNSLAFKLWNKQDFLQNIHI